MNSPESSDSFADVAEVGLPEIGESEPEPELAADDLDFLNNFMDTDEPKKRPDEPSTRANLKAQMRECLQEERDFLASIDKQAPGPENSQKRYTAKASSNTQAKKEKPEEQIKNKVLSCRDFLAVNHESVLPLIGKENDALLVRGEGMFIPGTGGVGKTLFTTAAAITFATGENFLKWQVQVPLKVLICQAELPSVFFQQRVRLIFDSYKIADERKAVMIGENLFIADIRQPFDLSSEDPFEFDEIGGAVDKLKIDILIVDPFLSFFRGGNENDNCQVRGSLDAFKRRIAEKFQCGLIFTDHMPKYSDSDKNPEQHFSMRGASAKRDWAASVIALSKMKTPDGQHGTFIKATVDKMRYGKVPYDPFSLRRDEHSFRHEVVKSHDIPLTEVARILDEAGTSQSKRELKKAISENLCISDHEARRLIEAAIEEAWIKTEPGKRNSTVHDASNKYLEWKNAQ